MADNVITTATEEGGFDLDDILDGVNMANNEVTVYLDIAAGIKAGELVQAIDNARNSMSTPEAQSITDVSPVEQMEEELAKYRDKSITFTMRSLSSAEMTACKQRIVATVRIDKKLSEAERIEAENARTEALYEQFLSRAIIKSVYNKTGAVKEHYSPDEVQKMRFKLDSHEWNKLKSTFEVALVQAEAVESLMSDPSFRGADADEGE